MTNIILLGDSVFDNQSYLASGERDVVTALRESMDPTKATATLLAVDGASIADIEGQLAHLPDDVTHLIVSVGGNDALYQKYVLDQIGSRLTPGECLDWLYGVRTHFEAEYRRMLDVVGALDLPVVVCTIYDPRYNQIERQRAIAGLSGLNDVITRAAAGAGYPVLDLRVLFDDVKYYANPIEPSAAGSARLAAAIKRIIDTHDFEAQVAGLYA